MNSNMMMLSLVNVLLSNKLSFICERQLQGLCNHTSECEPWHNPHGAELLEIISRYWMIHASSKSRTNEMTGHYWIGLIWHLTDTNALNSILNMFLLLKIYVSDRPVWSIHRMGIPNRDIAHNDQADKNIDFRLWWYPKTVVSLDGRTGINGDSFYFICRIIDRQLSILYIWIENLNVFRFECIQINVVGST